MHTEDTLTLLEKATVKIGRELRSFRDSTGVSFTTMELPKETAIRAKRAWDKQASSSQHNRQTQVSSAAPASAKVKRLNLSTYKLHALGDYVRMIRLFGTTDSYSTQIVSRFTGLSMIT